MNHCNDGLPKAGIIDKMKVDWLNTHSIKLRSLFRNNMLRVFAAGVALCGIVMLVMTFLPSNQKSQAQEAAIQLAATTVQQPYFFSTGWNYLPGTAVKEEGLLVSPSIFSIVQQDGSGGQPNPPINIYGQHLQVDGDFRITAQLAVAPAVQASLRLYGEVPIIADEFRIEPKSLRLTLYNDQLIAERWDGQTVQPVVSQTFKVTPQETNTLDITRQDGQFVIQLNGQIVGTLPEQNLLAEGSVWFGLESQGGDWLLRQLDVAALPGGTATWADTTDLPLVSRDPNGLQGLADRKRAGFLMGAAAALSPTVSDDSYRQVLFGNFGIITTENALKWQFIHPSPGGYDFHEADALIDLAAKNGVQIHAHTLVFGEANPLWVRNLPASQREAAMLEHIKTVAGHYKGKVTSWDVVNEPFDDDNWDELRPNIWYAAMGESYIAKALNAAREADPTAKLFINDYGLEEDSERWDAMLALVTKLKRQGVPIDGVGFQAHVYERADKINPTTLQRHIRQLATIGLKARISEMDVYSEDGTAVQASQYSQVVKACLAEPNCIAFTTWGVSDRYDWFKDDDGSVQQGQDFLWDTSMQPTPAVTALLQILY